MFSRLEINSSFGTCRDSAARLGRRLTQPAHTANHDDDYKSFGARFIARDRLLGMSGKT